MAYYDWSVAGKREEPGLHVAFSPDGVHWTKHDQGPLLPSLYGRAAAPPFVDEDPYREVPVQGKPPRKTWSYPLSMSDVTDVFWDPVRRVYVIIDKFWVDGSDGAGRQGRWCWAAPRAGTSSTGRGHSSSSRPTMQTARTSSSTAPRPSSPRGAISPCARSRAVAPC